MLKILSVNIIDKVAIFSVGLGGRRNVRIKRVEGMFVSRVISI